METVASTPGSQPTGATVEDAARFSDEVRTIDGMANNLIHPLWRCAGEAFLRIAGEDHADGAGEPSGSDRPNPREISIACAAYDGDVPNPVGASDWLWQWGQFLDHDIAETPVADPAEEFDVLAPAGVPEFDPFATGHVTIPLDRSHYNIVNGMRQQVNEITHRTRVLPQSA
jgi:hypothetical protein